MPIELFYTAMVMVGVVLGWLIADIVVTVFELQPHAAINIAFSTIGGVLVASSIPV